MSAYFCDINTFSIVTTLIINDLRAKYISGDEWDYLGKMSAEKLYISLQNLNNYALAERYGINMMELVDINYVPNEYETETIKYESLRNLIYQCSEGNATNEKLYKILCKYDKGLAEKFNISRS